ncbi:DUF3299 domain-containing protein [Ruegeria atlantica]|uniref:DUF3299 domain-containing protein n=1 Tax=Ruegeria atlantica TaxID=81569 RepID=UPI0014810829|nr:DUF3299 domain-containing protein [Ruegeria atlantica]
MKAFYTMVTAVALTLAGSAAIAAPGGVIDWSDLPDPSVQAFKDPYRELSPEMFDDVLFVVRMRSRLQQDVGSAEERHKWQELLTETEDALAAGGVDVDWLLAQRQVVTERRELAATAGNPLIDGQTITLAGFAIPAPADADGRPVAYLVPERGMCSHMPPPPPNQMIRVRLDGDWTPSFFHEPVRLTGKLTIAPSDQRMMVVDGLMPMHATFQLDADSAETLETRGDSLEWTQSGANRLRGAGNRKTGGNKASE